MVKCLSLSQVEPMNVMMGHLAVFDDGMIFKVLLLADHIEIFAKNIQDWIEFTDSVDKRLSAIEHFVEHSFKG